MMFSFPIRECFTTKYPKVVLTLQEFRIHDEVKEWKLKKAEWSDTY